MVKEKAPALLRQELSSPKWRPAPIGMSGVTDCYQPIERRLKLTRQCLAVLAEFRNPVGIVTKNSLVTRDINLLAQLGCGARLRGVHLADHTGHRTAGNRVLVGATSVRRICPGAAAGGSAERHRQDRPLMTAS